MPAKKTVITAALTGVLANRSQCPYIPYTPEEIAEEALRATNAGAAILHIHARKDDGLPAYDIETYRRIGEEVRKRVPNAILNYSTGAIGIPRIERIHHVVALKPEIAALNMGSMNYGIYSPKAKQFYHDFVFQNPFSDIQFFLEKMREAGTIPEMEIFDCGHINNATPFIDMGLLQKPYLMSFVMGVMGGIPATTQNLMHQIASVPEGTHWQVITISRKQWAMAAVALSVGGHFRVGLEDNFYLPNGEMAKSNGELVEAAVKLTRMLGSEPATIEETREMLGLPQL
ncbi:MAG: 3-keto-5-aminohexanoate cleavage protein [Chitinophagales bacterium]|nr:3-keto-5-aminohexanoate cleavage protein [Chitinophagales bacterium]MDW8273639.1 3-keto-5-aminohexanoate cleavage protein [Chitinophagales bacterium]